MKLSERAVTPLDDFGRPDSPKNAAFALACIVLFGAVVRLFVGVTYITGQCDSNLYEAWALGVQGNLFSAYDGHVFALDYPPLYLILLKPIGFLLTRFPRSTNVIIGNLLLKFFPILFDVCNIALFYCLAGRRRRGVALLCAALWGVNPSAIFNCAGWGQTDMIMAFELVLALWAVDENRHALGGALYAVAVLTKLQALYFAPIVLLVFLRGRAWKPLLRFMTVGLSLGVAVLLPFAVGSQNWLLPFKIYFGGFSSYKLVNLNAFNIYGLNPSLNLLPDETPIFGGFTYSHLNTLVFIGVIALLSCTVLFGKRHSVWIDAILLLECLFILTTRQHERYQVLVMAFCLCAWIRLSDFRFFRLFCCMSVVSFANQYLYLAQLGGMNVHYDKMMIVFSALNVLLFVYTMTVCLKYAFSKSQDVTA